MDNSPYVRSVLKALHILDIFGFDDPLGEGFSLSELSRRTDIASNTLCKILKTLVRAEYLTQDSAHRYHASHKTCMIQMVTAPHADLPDQIMQIIRARSRQLAAPIYFTTLSFGERKMVLQTSDSARQGDVIRFDAKSGDFIYTKPTGRILVSFANSGQLNDILARWGFPEERWNDIHSLPELIRAREVIRRQGFCVLHEANDVLAAAVPVKVERCNFLGALGAARPGQTGRQQEEVSLVAQLRDCADQIAAVLSR